MYARDRKRFRFYYWLKGVPENRPDGPWLYKDFKRWEEREDFAENLIPSLHAYAYERDWGKGLSRQSNIIKIPSSELIHYTK